MPGEILPIRTALCVDDDAQLLWIEKLFLEAHGYNVLTATSGHQALQILRQNPADAVVVDYQMPGMDGAEVAAEVRRTAPQTPILMHSGCEVPARVLNLVDLVISKGGPLSLLVAALDQLVSRRAERKAEAAEAIKARRFPRFPVEVALDVMVARGDATYVFRGRCTSISEGGLGAQLPEEVVPGEVVSLEVALAECALRPKAQVRYREGTTAGFQFLGLNDVQRAAIRRATRPYAQA